MTTALEQAIIDIARFWQRSRSPQALTAAIRSVCGVRALDPDAVGLYVTQVIERLQIMDNVTPVAVLAAIQHDGAEEDNSR